MKNTSAFIASLFPADAIEALQFAIRILEDPMFDMYPLPNDKRVEFLNIFFENSGMFHYIFVNRCNFSFYVSNRIIAMVI
jgi:hypothetical protein